MRAVLMAASGAVAASLCIAACDSVPLSSPPAAVASVPVAAGTGQGLGPRAVEPVVPSPAKPVLWGYVDGAGVAHFASTQLDSRYAQVLRETNGPRVWRKKTGPEDLLTWLEFSPDVMALQPMVDDAARATGVDPELLKAVITVESGYNQRAVSHAGAVGLMQLTAAAAERYSTPQERGRPVVERLLDARTNILTGARMLADLTRRYGGIDIALAAWNAGEGTVRRAGGRMPDIAETEAHVHLVLELYWALLQRKLPEHAQGFTMESASDRRSS